jgi:hypothetical protein
MRTAHIIGLGCLALLLAAGCSESSKSKSALESVDIGDASLSNDIGGGADADSPADTDASQTLDVVEISDIEGCNDPDLVPNTKDILERSCYPCHGLLGKTEGGMGHVLDADKLMALGQVTPGVPAESTLYLRMSSKQMPPANTKSPLPTDDEIALVEQWILCGAPALYDEAPREFVSPSELMSAIRTDLEALTENERPFARYFSLVNLYNAGVPSNDLKVYRGGLSKMVNSLSLGSKIVKPVAINDAETLYRIYIDDYGWDYNPNNPEVDIWESIIREYPYGIRYEDDLSDQNIEALSGTKMAYVNADWFVAASSQPRLYHTILQLPNSENGLEQMVGVNTVNNIATHADGLRAGFTQSGVSNSNRIIERHDANMGMYWKSFDFASESGQGNVVYFSVGPQGPNFTEEENAQFFSHDGGEFIFELPNGLHAYMITEVAGCRLDEAPTSIVDSPDQPQGSTIENGYSCMYCHREGIIPATDDVRPHWANFGVGAPNYTPEGPLNGKEYLEEIFEVYSPEGQMTNAQNEDRANYKEALEATGAVFGEYDPISLLKFEFDEDMDRNRVAAELGVTPEDFEAYVVSFPQINGLVGGALDATVGRETFEENFAEIVCTIFLGDPLKFHPACGGTCTPDCADAVCGDNDGCGGNCGDCPGGHECVAGACYPTCGDAVLCNGVVCDDGVECTADSCDIASGECVSTTVNGACADGDKCNGKEVCDAELGCLPGIAPECDDGLDCTTDSCDPFEICINDPDHTVCSDGEPCNGDEVCDLKIGCSEAILPPCDDGLDCTIDVCDPEIGCINTVDLELCDDGVACTIDSCEPELGCVNAASDFLCLVPNLCAAGAFCDGTQGCQPLPPPDCDDGNPCTVDSCLPAVGCIHAPDDYLCGDGNLCNGDEFCDVEAGCTAGETLICDDGLDCTADSCDPFYGCSNEPDSAFCADSVACTDDTCDPLLGCVNVIEDTACSDGLGCTIDVCDPVDGCSHSVSDDLCDDGIFCTLDQCSDVTGCAHTTIHAECDDSVDCTADQCSALVGCVYTTTDSLCTDENPCTADTCLPFVGCEHDTSGCDCLGVEDCDDGNACTTDLCDAGACLTVPIEGCCLNDDDCPLNQFCNGGTCGLKPCDNNADCDDGNLCTVDKCNPEGCSNTSDPQCCDLDGECDDGDDCTTDVCCTDGACLEQVSGPNQCAHFLAPSCCGEDADCDDGNICTTENCDPDTQQCTGSDILGCCNNNSDCKQPADGVSKCVNNNCETFGCLDSAGDCATNPCWTEVCGGGTCANNCGDGDNTCWDYEVLSIGFTEGTKEPSTGCTSGAALCVTHFECGVVQGVNAEVNCTDFNGPCIGDKTCNEATNLCK